MGGFGGASQQPGRRADRFGPDVIQFRAYLREVVGGLLPHSHIGDATKGLFQKMARSALIAARFSQSVSRYTSPTSSCTPVSVIGRSSGLS